ncbi:zinc ribbon domain-containing protein [Nocardioides sp. R-C-SC26]|uniref:zinc ribbon domain-containing protein n=1 Tax=Nocardioides sp. R-C-SC26 TaxID=2870414 RepID=UPI001E42D425|nr:zinc ribbon domain-containing protein [Nocardioides sp. R-C-SC26]
MPDQVPDQVPSRTSIGLAAYAAYVPLHVLDDNRLDPDAPRPRGARAVAAYDEDPVTMAVEVARRLGRAPAEDGLLTLATTSSPYDAKTAATIVHEALALEPSVTSLDLRGHRSGLSGLDLALRTGGLATAADLRMTRPGAPDELAQGDAAAAFLGGDARAAELVARATRTEEMLERWRLPGERVDRVWDERFTADLLVRAATDVVGQVLAEAGIERPDVVVVSSSNARAAATLRKRLGGDGADAAVEAQTGFTGAAHPGLLLASALDVAEPGTLVLLVSATDGADALLLRVGEGVRAARGGPSVAEQLARRVPVSYARYLRWRGLLDVQGPARPAAPAPAAPPIHRRRDWKYRLEGMRCDACSAVTTPPGPVCARCGSVEGGKHVSLRDLPARIVSVAQDRLTTMPEREVAMVVADVEGGGRLTAYATDVDPATLAVGDRMRPTFRRLWTTDAVHNYFWKLRPWEDHTDGE